MKRISIFIVTIIVIIVALVLYFNYFGKETTDESIIININDRELNISDSQLLINKQAGYRLYYPEKWFQVLSEESSDCLLTGSSNCIEDSISSVDPGSINGAYSGGFDMYIQSYKLNQDVNLEDLFEQDEDITGDFYESTENSYVGPEALTVDGRSAIRYSINAVYSSEPSYIEEILIRNGDQVIDIEAIVTEKSEFEIYRQEFENIINSFTFTN
ncbi:MAG: hypothetical protein V1838_05495 [Patescibacteria group bacterium]